MQACEKDTAGGAEGGFVCGGGKPIPKVHHVAAVLRHVCVAGLRAVEQETGQHHGAVQLHSQDHACNGCRGDVGGRVASQGYEGQPGKARA